MQIMAAIPTGASAIEMLMYMQQQLDNPNGFEHLSQVVNVS
jgi:hypothetical protein